MDLELELLIEQAERNLRTLELLVGRDGRPGTLDDLQERVQQLKSAYLQETNALTRQALKRAVERRAGGDRRQPRPVGT
jgi:hypothetical protein